MIKNQGNTLVNMDKLQIELDKELPKTEDYHNKYIKYKNKYLALQKLRKIL